MMRPLSWLVVCAALTGSTPLAALAGEPPPAGPNDLAQPTQPLDAPAAPLPSAPPSTQPGPPLVTPPPGTAEATAAPEEAAGPHSDTEPSAPRVRRFGDVGQMVLTGILSASFGYLGYSSGGSSSTSFSVQPAFDYFSSEGFSEGASVFFRYSDSTSGIGIRDRNVAFGATAQVGSNLWLGERVSFWPRLEIGVWQSRSTLNGGYGGSVSIDGAPVFLGPSTSVGENALFLEVFAPFLFHPASHFFVGFGPDGFVDVLHSAGSVNNRRRYLGASSTVGGWF
jgi:hypothetical protein